MDIDWNADSYVDVSSQQMQWALETLNRIEVLCSAKILDVGCGDGKITAALAELSTGTVIGIDRSPNMIHYAKQHHENITKSNLYFEVGEATKYVADHPVDIITSFTALHWVPDHRLLLRHFNTLLSKCGKLVLQFPGQGNADALIEIALQTMQLGRWVDYFKEFIFPWVFFDPSLYKQFLEEAGFEPNNVELIGKRMTHEGAEGLAKWMETTWLPFTEILPENKRNIFLSEIVNTYHENIPVDESGKVYTQMYRLQVIAEKKSDITTASTGGRGACRP